MSEPGKDAPFNAGDEAQVRERKKKAGLREDLRLEGLRYIMADRRGRAFMRHLILDKLITPVGDSMPRAIFTGNSTTFYNTALAELGGLMRAEIELHCEKEYSLMKLEAKGL